MPETSKIDEFNFGYLIAVSNVMNMHGEDVIAEDLLLALGITRSRMESLGLDDYDRKPLRKLFREIERKRRISRQRDRKDVAHA